ncbi:transposase [Jiulongibacter sp. NS-SX5]|uniref:transposase n=1 Tax=Jiulongibacter sp. NS-SX5 TaxID=3463854 RepID=UPI004058ACBD
MSLPQRKKIRLEGFDYSSEALYFITTNVKSNLSLLGRIENSKMVLNQFGRIVEKQWDWLFEQYPYIKSHAFVVMPNHIHGVIEIKKPDIPAVKIKSIPQLIGAFKTTSSKQIRLAGLKNFQWHKSYHDHIIRSHISYQRIVNYIAQNPAKWNEDRFK